ncbi:hypothetical protein CRV24_002691 [Beauveria bassiana]|nr:hypothetical protein CRV24_002691 [Beauveria bassiana]KAH8718078.1 hypothetical protein HC256_002735 [Beauveria bassiana]
MSFALFRQILPLIITLCVVGGIGFVLYHVYLSVTKMGETASQKMGKKNVVLTKDGMRVGVKNVRNERYVDQTQSYVVKAWNLGQAQEPTNNRRKRVENPESILQTNNPDVTRYKFHDNTQPVCKDDENLK